MLYRLKKIVRAMPPLAIPLQFIQRVLPGYRAYRRILRACPLEDGWRVYFMDYDGSGDTYLSCAYLKTKGALDAHAAFAADGALSMKIAKLFPFGRYVQVKPRAALNVRVTERFLGERLRLMPLLYESDYLEYSGVMRVIAGHRGLHFLSMLKIGWEARCGIPYDESPWEQPEFAYDPQEIDELFAHHGLIAGKTALLAPYAGKHEMWGVPMRFYEALADRLREDGWTVCTNADGKTEPPVPGTKPLLVPHRLMRAFCERAGMFIGLRSGLCDIVSGARGCRIVVIYGEFITPSIIAGFEEFFSLQKMGLKINQITEVAFSAIRKEADYSIE